MSTPPGNDGKRTALAAAGVVAAIVLCCLPLLIAAGALGAIGAVLGNPWVISTTAIAVIALIGWRVRHHPSRSADDACCPPHQRSDPNPQPPHHRKEP